MKPNNQTFPLIFSLIALVLTITFGFSSCGIYKRGSLTMESMWMFDESEFGFYNTETLSSAAETTASTSASKSSSNPESSSATEQVESMQSDKSENMKSTVGSLSSERSYDTPLRLIHVLNNAEILDMESSDTNRYYHRDGSGYHHTSYYPPFLKIERDILIDIIKNMTQYDWVQREEYINPVEVYACSITLVINNTVITYLHIYQDENGNCFAFSFYDYMITQISKEDYLRIKAVFDNAPVDKEKYLRRYGFPLEDYMY